MITLPANVSPAEIVWRADIDQRTLDRATRGLSIRPSTYRRIARAFAQLGLPPPPAQKKKRRAPGTLSRTAAAE